MSAPWAWGRGGLALAQVGQRFSCLGLERPSETAACPGGPSLPPCGRTTPSSVLRGSEARPCACRTYLILTTACTFHILQARETEAQGSWVALPKIHSSRAGSDPSGANANAQALRMGSEASGPLYTVSPRGVRPLPAVCARASQRLGQRRRSALSACWGAGLVRAACRKSGVSSCWSPGDRALEGQSEHRLPLHVCIWAPPDNHTVFSWGADCIFQKWPQQCPGPQMLLEPYHSPSEEVEAIFPPLEMVLVAGIWRGRGEVASSTGPWRLYSFCLALSGCFAVEYSCSVFHAEWPRGAATRRGCTERPHGEATQSGHTEWPHGEAARRGHAEWPHGVATGRGHVERPHGSVLVDSYSSSLSQHTRVRIQPSASKLAQLTQGGAERSCLCGALPNLQVRAQNKRYYGFKPLTLEWFVVQPHHWTS